MEVKIELFCSDEQKALIIRHSTVIMKFYFGAIVVIIKLNIKKIQIMLLFKKNNPIKFRTTCCTIYINIG